MPAYVSSTSTTSNANIWMIFLVLLLAQTSTAEAGDQLQCDTITEGILAEATSVDSYFFDAADGERVYLQINERAGSPGIEWQLLDSNETPIRGFTNSVDYDTGPLSQSLSPYEIRIRDINQTDSGALYAIHLQRLTHVLTCEGTEVPCDQPLDDTFEDSMDSDVFTFEAQDGEHISLLLDDVGPTGDVEWRLLDKEGTPILGFRETTFFDIGPLSVSQSPYQLHLRERIFNGTGDYTLTLQRLSAFAACEAIALPCEDVLDLEIEHPFDTDILRFEAVDGERISLLLDDVGNGDLEWRLLDRNGEVVHGFRQDSFFDIGPLSTDLSPYGIQGREFAHNATALYSVQMQRLTSSTACEAIPLECDVSMSIDTTHPFNTDLLTFDAVDGEIVSILIDDTIAGDTEWRVINRDGEQILGFRQTTFWDVGPLEQSGSPYRIQTRERVHNSLMSYTTNLQRLSATSACESEVLLCDEPQELSIEDPFDTDLLEFEVVDGEIVGVLANDVSTGDLEWRVVNGDGLQVIGFREAFDFDIGPLSADGNPYRIQTRERVHNNTADYVFRIQRLLEERSCEPSVLENGTVAQDMIEHPFDTDLHLFLVESETEVTITVLEDDSQVMTTEWRVVDRDGIEQCGFSRTDTRVCGPMAMSGNPYRVEVREYAHNNTGSYTVVLSPAATETGSGFGVLPDSFEWQPWVPRGHVAETVLQMPAREAISLAIYDVTGRQLRQTDLGDLQPGTHFVRWNTEDLPSGLFFMSLSRSGQAMVKRFAHVR